MKLKFLVGGLVSLFGFTYAVASPPPPNFDGNADAANENPLPDEIRKYLNKRGFSTRVETARLLRDQARRKRTEPTFGAPPITRGGVVSGTVEIPVFPLLFSDSAGQPYQASTLQNHLYGTAVGQRSVTTHYQQMSGNMLTLSGQVFDWTRTSQTASNSIGNLGATLTEVLSKMDGQVDFSQYDNDGPDGIPASGDDDGYVDFIAFVQPNIGNECGTGRQIHSHKWTMEGYPEGVFVTNDPSGLGNNQPVRIAEYVIQPALSCDGQSIIEIGVFAHEYGHAFTLPDLYNTSKPADSSGVSSWGLMGSGSWGGTQLTPDKPVHMLAWSKEFLGWIRPIEVSATAKNISIRPYAETGDAVRIDYNDFTDPSDERYLLLTYREKVGFDDTLAAGGLLIEEITNPIISAGQWGNNVNAISGYHGVNIIEADGGSDLQLPGRFAHANNVLIPTDRNQNLPAAVSNRLGITVCNIRKKSNGIRFDINMDQTSCPGPSFGAAPAPDDGDLKTVLEKLLKGN